MSNDATFNTTFQNNINFGMEFSADETFNTVMAQAMQVVVNNYEQLINKPSINGTTLIGNMSLSSLGMLAGRHATTAQWNSMVGYIPQAGEICIYDDYRTITDGEGNEKTVAGVKIGDGLAYVVDLPFLTSEIESALYEHLADTISHINSMERTTWNSKLEFRGVNDEELVLG